MLLRARMLRENYAKYKNDKDDGLRRRAHLELDRWLMTHRTEVIDLVVEALENRNRKQKRLWTKWPTQKHRCTTCNKKFAESHETYRADNISCCSYTCWATAISTNEEEEANG